MAENHRLCDRPAWELDVDFYELTMLAGFFAEGRHDRPATFDLFYRKFPRDRNYVVAAGLEQVVDYLVDLKFSDATVDYVLSRPPFENYPLREEFSEYLRSLRFTGDAWAVPEGTLVFPNEPIVEVQAPLGEAQLVETYLLAVVGHQSLVATKAARVVRAARGKPVVDFGSRRAHGREAAVFGARAAYVGGCVATSNVLAGYEFGIPVTGTQAHSWVMSFPTELEAFRAYARAFPDHCVLLIDTYDTERGAANAAVVAAELAERGHRLAGVRVDSGDLAEETSKVRRVLKERGAPGVKIFASSDLNERKIAALEGGPDAPDAYGVGTEMEVSKDDPTLSVVYKLVECDGQPCIKLSPGKVTYPGAKQVFRSLEGPAGDVLALRDEKLPGEPLLERVVACGKRVAPPPPLSEARERCAKSLEWFEALDAPFEVKPSDALLGLIERLRREHAPHKQ
ncbi:MAG: nicotinate phosphoribosyltransferase [Promethearchaeota archaeon]